MRRGIEEPDRTDRAGTGQRFGPGGTLRSPSNRPAASSAVHRQLRPLGEPRHVRVDVDSGGTPIRVSPGRGPWRGVIAIRERWRIDDEWWRNPLSREYFQVILEDGRVVELYRDMVKKAWYAHGGGSAFADR